MNKEQTQQFSELLLKLTNDLAVSTTLDEALERLVEITTTTINADRGTIFLNDERTGEPTRESRKETFDVKFECSITGESPDGPS